MTKGNISTKTRNNWLIDAAVFIGGLVAAITGIYFLYLPSGGYQGGRNPMYGVTILFERHTWDDLHTWFGVLMIAAAAVHITIHWQWIKSMALRMARSLIGKGARMNRYGYFNLAINATVGLSFLLTAVSGIYFLFAPSGGWAADPGFIFTRTTWDLIHTWAGVALISAAVIHFAIHWRWVTKVTRNVFRGPRPLPAPANGALRGQLGA